MNRSLSHALPLAATVAAGALALRSTLPGSTAPVDAEAQARRIAGDYRSWGRLDGPMKVAPALCSMPPGAIQPGVMPGTFEQSAADDGPHGKKLYRLYARDPAAYRGVESGAPQAHQVLVKEAFEATPYEMPGPGRAPADVIDTPDGPVRPGAYAGLFVMWHDASDDADEERWTYATLSATGEVTATGRIESCVACHAAAPHGGLFGLEK